MSGVYNDYKIAILMSGVNNDPSINILDRLKSLIS